MTARSPAPAPAQSQTAAVCCRWSLGGVASPPEAGTRAEAQTEMLEWLQDILWNWIGGRIVQYGGQSGKEVELQLTPWLQKEVVWSVENTRYSRVKKTVNN